MIYDKQFSKEDLEFFLKDFNAAETLFSFINYEKSEPEVIKVAEQIDPELLITAAMIPSISKDNLITGLKTFSRNYKDMPQHDNDYKSFNFGREDLQNDESLKQFVEAHPLSQTTTRILTLGNFDDDWLISRTAYYIAAYAESRDYQNVTLLIRISFNKSLTRDGRLRFFKLIQKMNVGLETLIFNFPNLESDEFFQYYDAILPELRHESVLSSECPDWIRDELLDSQDWSKVEKLAMSELLLPSQYERLTEMLIEEIVHLSSGREYVMIHRTLTNLLDNASLPVELLKKLARNKSLLEDETLHPQLLSTLGARIHEDEELHKIAAEIIESYNLTSPHDFTASSDDDEAVEEERIKMETLAGNTISFFYSILRNINASAETLLMLNTESTATSGFFSLPLVPHPNLGDIQAAGILERSLGTPFQPIVLLHIRKPEVMRNLPNFYEDLDKHSKLAIIINPAVHGETYLELALLEEDLFIRGLLMRAGAEAYIDENIGHLFLNEVSEIGKLEAWLGSGGNPMFGKVSYASFTSTS